jgi:hypothetical protein
MDYVALRTDAVDRAGIMAFGGILASPPARQAFGSWAPTTLTVPSPRSNAPEGACSVVATSLPASPTLTSPIRMATKLRSGSSEQSKADMQLAAAV